MPFTSWVPATVPSLFHSSTCRDALLARKKTVPPALTRLRAPASAERTQDAGAPIVTSASFVSLTAVLAAQLTRTRALPLFGGGTVHEKYEVLGTLDAIDAQVVPPS